MKARQFIVTKGAQGIAKAIVPHTPWTVNNPVRKSLEEGLSKDNEIMQTMANHKFMSMAPQVVRSSLY